MPVSTLAIRTVMADAGSMTSENTTRHEGLVTSLSWIPSEAIEGEVTSKMPEVRNVIIDLFNSKRPQDLATPELRDYLKDEIKNAINGFMVSGKVRGVYFTNFALVG